MLENNKTNRKGIWLITKGYLEFMIGNISEAKKTFKSCDTLAILDDMQRKQSSDLSLIGLYLDNFLFEASIKLF